MATVDIDKKVELIHGFSNKIRLQILECIKDKEMTVSQIVETLAGNQSSISQHLACLRGCGLIVGRQEGKYVYYKIRNEQIRQLLMMFDDVLEVVQDDMGSCKSHLD